MTSVNRVTIVGRLGADPEICFTKDDKAACFLNIATAEAWHDQSGKKIESTEWHKIVVWGRAAENCAKHLKKGRLVYLEGRIKTRTWNDETNVVRYATEIHTNAVVFLDAVVKVIKPSLADKEAEDGGGANDETGPSYIPCQECV